MYAGVADLASTTPKMIASTPQCEDDARTEEPPCGLGCPELVATRLPVEDEEPCQ